MANFDLTDAFDPQKFLTQYDEIRSKMGDAMRLAGDLFWDFGENLSKVWASQNAVDCANSLISGSWGRLDELWHEKANHLREILKNSYNIWARANQLSEKDFSWIGSDAVILDERALPLTTEIDGKVGMNKAEVETLISEFEASKADILSALDDVPTSIELYDAGSVQTGTYSKSIAQIKDAVVEAIEAAVKETRSYIDTEVDNVELTIEQATTELEL